MDSPSAIAPGREVRARAALSALAAGPLAVACFAVFGPTAYALLAAFFVTVLAVLSVIDLAERRLPNRVVLPSAALVLVAQIALSPDRTAEWVLAAFGAGLFFFLPLLVYPAGMGMGDVKLALLLGAMLGKAVVTALLLATVAGAAAALVVLALRGSSARRQAIPFGPFLALGGVVALFVGRALAF